MGSSGYGALLDDLAAEERALDAVVAPLDGAGWETPTPADGWTVRDSVAHLAATEEWALLSLTDSDAFTDQLDRLTADSEVLAAGMRDGLLGRAPPSDGDTLRWWRDARGRVAGALRELDPRDRLVWFGPPMSAMSFATARLMETWAHGRDVRDALGTETPVNARLRHVAELGVRTRGFAYRSRGQAVPEGDVRVELDAPDGTVWTWGDPAATESVRGPALDFCLVVTQRRHPGDAALVIEGPLATEWLGIAQAFAGPPTEHRPPRSLRS